MSHLRSMMGGKSTPAGYQVMSDDSSDPTTEEEAAPSPSAAPASSDSSSSSSDDDSSDDGSSDSSSNSSGSDIEPPPGEDPPADHASTVEPMPTDSPVIDAAVTPVIEDSSSGEEKKEQEADDVPLITSRDPELGLAPEKTIIQDKSGAPPVNLPKDKKAEEAPEDACLSNRRVQVGIVAMIVAVAIILLVTILVSAIDRGETTTSALEPTVSPAPSAMPSFAPNFVSAGDEVLLDLWASVVGEVVYEEGTPYNDAAQHLLFRDPQRAAPSGRRLQANDDERVYTENELDNIQRYLLTFLWFSSTDSGRKPWLSCNPNTFDFTVEECILQKPIRKLPSGALQFTQVPWTRWLSGANECDWAGVTCTATESGREAVTGIDLGGQGLAVPVELLIEVMKLPELDTLTLPYNNIYGELNTALETLDTLDLTDNLLTGPVIKLGGLTSLTLAGNQLSGTVPAELFEFTTPLVHLNLGGNKLDGTIPAEASFALKLTSLQLQDNGLTGSIPPELGQLPLASLRVNGNKLIGKIPVDVINVNWLDTLEELWLFGNQLTGEIPEILGSASRMLDLRFSDNNLMGTIPETIYDLDRLFRLDLANNRFSGGLSISLTSQLSNLEVLDLSKNFFEGRILLDNRLSSLESLSLEFNQFQGAVPNSICRIPGLEDLSADCLPQNNPSNPCPCCTTCCNRSTETCSSANVSPVPGSPSVAPAQSPSAFAEVEQIQAWARSRFGPSIDQTSGSPHSLVSFWFVQADTSGVSVGDQTFFQRYVLALFYFSTRPWKSCNPSTSVSCLYQKFVIAEDGSTSVVPTPETRFLAPVSECQWVGVSCSSGTVIGIDLPGQEIGGSIPTELMALNTLRTISLEYNDLAGPIPTQIGNLARLSALRLNNNALTGVIPTQLGRATFLSEALFQNNQLQGSMPSDVCDLAPQGLTTLVSDCSLDCACCSSCV